MLHWMYIYSMESDAQIKVKFFLRIFIYYLFGKEGLYMKPGVSSRSHIDQKTKHHAILHCFPTSMNRELAIGIWNNVHTGSPHCSQWPNPCVPGVSTGSWRHFVSEAAGSGCMHKQRTHLSWGWQLASAASCLSLGGSTSKVYVGAMLPWTSPVTQWRVSQTRGTIRKARLGSGAKLKCIVPAFLKGAWDFKPIKIIIHYKALKVLFHAQDLEKLIEWWL